MYLNLKIFNFLNIYNLRAFFPVFSRGLLQEQLAGRNRAKYHYQFFSANQSGYELPPFDIINQKNQYLKSYK